MQTAQAFLKVPHANYGAGYVRRPSGPALRLLSALLRILATIAGSGKRTTSLTRLWVLLRCLSRNREKGRSLLGNVLRKIAALSLAAKVLLAIGGLMVLGLSAILRPLVAVVALFVPIVSIAALIFRIIRRRPLRNWGVIALSS